ncbi:MAG: PadR family transcriptional regulator [Marinosulfonomonas sp.]|nr:PadR family transcriptional regulator [Marinosulfonomonas sp.]
MSGYELKREIEGSLQNFWSESFGQLYPNLHMLNQAHLISGLPPDEATKRQKKVYQITDAGREALRGWIATDPASRPPRDELLLKLFFASEGGPDVVRDHSRHAREKALVKLRRYKAIREQIQSLNSHQERAKYWLMTLSLGISQTQNFIHWCDETLDEFTELGR